MDNRTIANRLIDYAHHLEAREASLYRIKAYRRAAETILRLERPAADIVAERGRNGLKELPGIGATCRTRSIAWLARVSFVRWTAKAPMSIR